MYNRFDAGVHPRENLGDLSTMLKDHVAMLDEHTQILTKVKFAYFIKLKGKWNFVFVGF